MATKNNCKCLENSAPDEPIFVLCARDRLAPLAVEDWATHAYRQGVNPEKVNEAVEVAAAMRKWQEEHGMKLPD